MGKKRSEIGVDGHDVLLITYPPMRHHTPPTPRAGGVGRGAGHVRLGVGWGIGGSGVLEEYRIHNMHTYTHVSTRITVGEKSQFS